MKTKLSLVVATILVSCVTAYGQSNFAGLEWGASAAQVSQRLTLLDFKEVTTDEWGDPVYKGVLTAAAIVTTKMAEGKLCGVHITIYPDPHTTKADYDKIKKILKEKYGEPSSVQEALIPDVKNIENAIGAGHAKFECQWTTKGQTRIQLTIERLLTITLQYDSSEWGKESIRRAAKSDKLL